MNLVLTRVGYLALEDQCPGHGSLHLEMQESSRQWANVCSYIKATSQRQSFQRMKGHVS